MWAGVGRLLKLTLRTLKKDTDAKTISNMCSFISLIQ